MSRNKKILIALTLGLGVASFFAFRKRKIRFFDYVWCADEACSNIEDAIAYCNPSQSREVSVGGADGNIDPNTPDNVATTADNKPLTDDEVEVCVANANTIVDGMYNLIFAQPHNLKIGQRIYVEQDEGNTHSDYDGWTQVTHIYNDYIISTDKPRLDGSTGNEGGFIYVESYFDSLFN